MTDDIHDPIYPANNNIPSPPNLAGGWVDILKWCAFVMDSNDPQAHFTASCLAYAHYKGGLTNAQNKACERLVERIFERYQMGTLKCQQDSRPTEVVTTKNMRGIH